MTRDKILGKIIDFMSEMDKAAYQRGWDACAARVMAELDSMRETMPGLSTKPTKRAGPISLWPLKTEDAISAILSATPKS